MITIYSRTEFEAEWQRQGELSILHANREFLDNDLQKLCAYIALDQSRALKKRVYVQAMKAMVNGPDPVLCRIDSATAQGIIRRQAV